MTDNLGGSGGSDVNALLGNGAEAVAQGQYEVAVHLFGEALSASSTTEVQYYVAYQLNQAGRNAELLGLLRPYYRASSATAPLAVAVLNAAVAVGDRDLAGWMLAHMPEPESPLVGQATQAAWVALGGVAGPDETVGDARQSGWGRRTWLELVAGVVVVALLTGFVGVRVLGGGNKQAYCTGLASLVKDTNNSDANPNSSSGSSSPTPAQVAKLRALVGVLQNSAPSGIRGSTGLWASDVNQFIAMATAKGSVNVGNALSVAFEMAAEGQKMVKWGRANCPAGSIPAQGNGASGAGGSGAGGGSSSGGSSSAPTTTLPAKVINVSGGTQALSGGGESVSVNILQAVANPPVGAGGLGSGNDQVAFEVTVTNTGSTAVDLSTVTYSASGGGSFGGGSGTDGATTLGTALPAESLAQGATASGWLVLGVATTSTGTQTLMLGFGDIPAQGSWTVG
jgi:hypothetical protein